MTRFMVLAAFGLLAVSALFTGRACAAEDKAAAEKTITGTVASAKDDNDQVTSITITADDGTVTEAVVDATSKKMADELDCAKAVVTGTPNAQGKLKVKSYKAAPEEKAKEE